MSQRLPQIIPEALMRSTALCRLTLHRPRPLTSMSLQSLGLSRRRLLTMRSTMHRQSRCLLMPNRVVHPLHRGYLLPAPSQAANWRGSGVLPRPHTMSSGSIMWSSLGDRRRQTPYKHPSHRPHAGPWSCGVGISGDCACRFHGPEAIMQISLQTWTLRLCPSALSL